MNQASAPWPSHMRGCCSEHVVRERKVLRALFLIAFLSSVFCFSLSSVYHRPILEERRIEKWDSLMFLHSPALLLTADVEDGRLEIGFIISWGLFIPLLLISFEVRFIDPLEEKNFQKSSWTYPQGSAQLLPGEGACVTFYAVRPMERVSMAVVDFSTPLRCARNDRREGLCIFSK